MYAAGCQLGPTMPSMYVICWQLQDSADVMWASCMSSRMPCFSFDHSGKLQVAVRLAHPPLDILYVLSQSDNTMPFTVCRLAQQEKDELRHELNVKNEKVR